MLSVVGEIAATLLSRFAVPVLYYWFVGNTRERVIREEVKLEREESVYANGK